MTTTETPSQYKPYDKPITAKDWEKAREVKPVGWVEFMQPHLETVNGIVEISEELHDDFLNCLPPIYGCGCWAVSEPYDHRGENGSARYSTFSSFASKYFYHGLKTKAQIFK